MDQSCPVYCGHSQRPPCARCPGNAALPPNDVFELSLDDLLFLRSIHPARIESLTFARSAPGAPCELLIWVLDSSQPLMVVSSVAFFNATRAKKRCRVLAA